MDKQELLIWLEEIRFLLIDKATSMPNHYETLEVKSVKEMTYRMTMSIDKELLLAKANALGEVIEKILYGEAKILGLDKFQNAILNQVESSE